MAAKGSLLAHFKAVRAELCRLGGTAQLDMLNFAVSLRVGEVDVRWLPKFLELRAGQRLYTARHGPFTRKFCGWRPYHTRVSELLASKLRIKAAWREAGVNTPPWWAGPDLALLSPGDVSSVVVKKDQAAFGEGVYGPYRDAVEGLADVLRQAGTSEGSAEDGEGVFLEAFVPGVITKVWCWGREPLVMEQQDAPGVVGDGQATVRQLLARGRGAKAKAVDWSRVERALLYDGVDLETVLPLGRRQRVDILYGSTLGGQAPLRDLALGTAQARARFRPMIEAVMGLAPEFDAPPQLWTADALETRDGRFWFLEANSNPIIHPHCYRAMLATELSQPGVFAPFRS